MATHGEASGSKDERGQDLRGRAPKEENRLSRRAEGAPGAGRLRDAGSQGLLLWRRTGSVGEGFFF